MLRTMVAGFELPIVWKKSKYVTKLKSYIGKNKGLLVQTLLFLAQEDWLAKGICMQLNMAQDLLFPTLKNRLTLFTLINIFRTVKTLVSRGTGASVGTIDGTRITDSVRVTRIWGASVVEMAEES